MSFDNKKAEFSRQHIYVVEIDMSYCSLSFGVAPCTATGSGDDKCYNTRASSQDIANYADSTKTYRFCTNVSPHPVGLDAIPSIDRINMTPSKIDLKGGLGTRSSLSITFNDHPSSDLNIDKYVGERSFIASDRGSYWTKFRARNPDYQNQEIRVLSGYLNEDGSYDSANFQTRTYLVDRLDVSSGRATLTAKDPLKLVMSKKAQAPVPSTGLLQSALSASATTATLIPAGVGNSEYDTSGWVLIKSEVMAFTRSGDTLTLTRAQYNTVATTHAANDTVQQCLEYSGATRGQLDFIIDDLLTNFANVPSAYIPTTEWDSEVSTYLSGLLSAIIVKPMDVNKLLMELSESMPHYLWWDERTSEIQLTALKAPPTSANVLDMDGNIIEDSMNVKDRPDLRASTIFVNFGQFDPTKKLNEIGNYKQTYIRADTDSITTYGGSEIKVINSRWISDTNKAAALQLAALIGRRFSDIPREINFELDAKDSSTWIGQSRAINHRDITDFSGSPVDTVFQITSVSERDVYKYSALEFTYGDSLPEDEGGGDPDVDLVILGSSDRDINLRTIYDGLFTAPDATTQVKFVIQNGVIIGGSTSTAASLDTGSWPTGATVTLQVDSGGYSVGKGGDGSSSSSVAAEDGGDAINLNHDLILINNGIIGGGGGGGGADRNTGSGGTGTAAGGGGAGDQLGNRGTNSFSGSGLYTNTLAEKGTLENGGDGSFMAWNSSEPFNASGGGGGDLGQAGTSKDSAGGGAGRAIVKNGYTLTQTVAGDIRGAIV
jgi:hypothetical protein